MSVSSGITARIELASRNLRTGDTLYTFVLRYPRIIHGEIMTHRVFSRNAASSRAIPMKKLRSLVWNDPAVPVYLGANQKGMQAGAEITGRKYDFLRWLYRIGRVPAIGLNWLMEKCGLHKQIANRLLEPWMWMEVVVSATELDNFFGLRCHEAAEPHFQDLAKQMRRLVDRTKVIFKFMVNAQEDVREGCHFGYENIRRVQILWPGDWHTPFCDDLVLQDRVVVSSARCARVSYYLPEDGKLSTFVRDKATYDSLTSSTPIHASPFEHVAMAAADTSIGGMYNFRGFRQLRYFIENKHPIE